MSMMVSPYWFAAGGGVKALRWRLRFPDGAPANANSRLAIQEIQFRATAGGADQVPPYATNSTLVTTNSFGSSQFSGTFNYRNAFDDANNNPWMTLNGGMSNAHVGFIFTAPVSVGEISVTVPTTASTFFFPPNSIVVERSDDGTTWTTEWTIAGALAWTSGETKVFTKP